MDVKHFFKQETDTLANSEDPNEMPHNAALHQGLHCLFRQNQSEKKQAGMNLIRSQAPNLVFSRCCPCYTD